MIRSQCLNYVFPLIIYYWWINFETMNELLTVVATTSIILSSNKMQNGDFLVLANPGPPGKMAIKMERFLL